MGLECNRSLWRALARQIDQGFEQPQPFLWKSNAAAYHHAVRAFIDFMRAQCGAGVFWRQDLQAADPSK
jgi:hypothetical protein